MSYMSACSQAANPAASLAAAATSAAYGVLPARASSRLAISTCAVTPRASSRADVVASSLRCAPVIAVRVGAVVSSTTARVGKGTSASAIALPKSRRFVGSSPPGSPNRSRCTGTPIRRDIPRTWSTVSACCLRSTFETQLWEYPTARASCFCVQPCARRISSSSVAKSQLARAAATGGEDQNSGGRCLSAWSMRIGYGRSPSATATTNGNSPSPVGNRRFLSAVLPATIDLCRGVYSVEQDCARAVRAPQPRD
jgi:hypothetical protein